MAMWRIPVDVQHVWPLGCCCTRGLWGSQVARASTIAARVRVFRVFHDGTHSGPGCVANPSNAQLLELLPTAVGPLPPQPPTSNTHPTRPFRTHLRQARVPPVNSPPPSFWPRQARAPEIDMSADAAADGAVQAAMDE